MIIKSIKLENFRQYKNTNYVEFSTDPERNVTIILGVNTSGKTTLIQAFNWCLYETTTFKSKDMLLNSDLAASLTYGTYAIVRVEVVLVHDNKEYTVVRSQKFYGTGNAHVRGDKSQLTVSYKEDNGNSAFVSPVECENTINKILPKGLSDYFFFDGERIQDINNKKDVVAAVRGLMGLDIINEAVDHLEPNKSSSLISKLRGELNIGSDSKSRELRSNLSSYQSQLQDKKARLETIEQEIDFARAEKERLAELLRSTAEVRDLQKQRDRLNNELNNLDVSLKSANDRILTDFNRDYLNFFIQPLISKAKNILANSNKQVEGIPEMDATSIEYILKRGRCICGCDLRKNQGAVDNIKYEESLLPPHQIGTIVRTYNETCDMQISRYQNAPLDLTIADDFEQIRRYERRRSDINTELKNISNKIKELGAVNSAQIENDYNANDKVLEDKLRQKGSIEQSIKNLSTLISDAQKQINNLAVQCERNNLINREIAYATAAYTWFRESYDQKEKEVKRDLLSSVNNIFEKMYHGSRQVTIDDKYRIQLTTTVGGEKISTDESKGLEAVKNFSFISGLVDLARKKARTIQNSSNEDEPELFSTEAYPIVMDAPFSNVDEQHIKNISVILPEIAEQVILIIMKKDWTFAEETMGSKVGASYQIEKVDNSDTYSMIRRL